MLARLHDRLASLTLGLWLMGGVLLLLAAGSFVGGEGTAAMNEVPLLLWLKEASFAQSWWLWITVVLLAILALNTVLCSISSLRAKAGRERFPALIAPQVMHAGFLLIVLAHLASAYGGFKEALPVMDGQAIGFPDGSRVEVENIRAEFGPMGMPTDYSADLRFRENGALRMKTVSPNHPVFYRGIGIYLKEAQLDPVPAAYIEVHREPGAGLALAGALLFTVGNVVLVAVRRGSRE